MNTFNFIRARDTDEAIRVAHTSPAAKFIAGGTNLVDLMKMGVEQPSQLVDITPLELQKIETLADGTIRIGAMVRNSDLAYHAIIAEKYPVLSQALLSGASPQLRNMATVGGNLLQRTRCPYFYDVVFACNKRVPNAGCSAMDGYNRSHAVLGTSDQCIATHPSDMCVAMAVLDAIVQVQGPAGSRAIPILDFHLLPGNTPEKENVLRPGDLITAVDLPPISFSRKSHYLKVRDRASYEFALASAAVALDIQNGIVLEARIALGGVGTKPWRAMDAEKSLKGISAGEEAYRKAAEVALQGARPHKFNQFKIELVKRTLMRALITAEKNS
jgi:xanthine dehydrogenase YagS FAD-binding subunit